MMKYMVFLLILSVLEGCNSGTVEPIPWYEPHINNHDTGFSLFWQYVPTNRLAELTTRKLREHYQSQTNYLSGSVVVHRYVGTNHAICLYKSILCNSQSNTFLIADGYGLTNPVAKATFDEVSQEIRKALEREVSGNRMEGAPK